METTIQVFSSLCFSASGLGVLGFGGFWGFGFEGFEGFWGLGVWGLRGFRI